jgi:ferric-dicitrate binding protein FerR (iron transport regulator)
MTDVSPLTDAQLALFDKYLAGECSDAERAVVVRLMDQSPALDRRLSAIRAAMHREGQRETTATSWETFRTRVLDIVPVVQQSLPRVYRVRATSYSQGERDSFPRRARIGKPLPTRSLARATRTWFGVTGVAGLLVAGLFVGARKVHFGEPGVTRTYTTAPGQVAALRLSDGTRVILAPRTAVHLAGFGSASRMVTLDGEAYFDVTRSTGTPFVVRTGVVNVRVLGTTFLVRHYNDPYGNEGPGVRVAVTSGKVSVATEGRPEPGVIVSAGKVAVMTDSLTSVRTVDNVNAETEWVRGGVAFYHAPVPEVLATLTRWYGYAFKSADTTLAHQYVTLWLSTRSSAEALATLEQLLDVTLTVTGDTITMTPHERRRHRGPTPTKDYDIWMPPRDVGR